MLERGFPTGLCDSMGTEIKVGDKVKINVDCNVDLHGEWAIYEIKLRGIVPVISYLVSEKGQILPVGYTGRPLSDLYDQKIFLWVDDLKRLRPVDEDVVIVKDI